MGKKKRIGWKHSKSCAWHGDWHACNCGAHKPAKRRVTYRPRRTPRVWLVARIMELQDRLEDPEGEIQLGINARYTRDLREREMQHHADWDAEVVVHKMAAARWMRSCVLELVTDEAVRAQIEALPLVPE